MNITPSFPPSNCPLSVRLSWDARRLLVLVQWKMPAVGAYVLGLEPANCHVEGRPAERERGTLVSLQPGQAIEYNLELSVDEE